LKRRHIIWGVLAGAAVVIAGPIVFVLSLGPILRKLFLPKSILEPSTRFNIGPLADFTTGVDQKFLHQYRIFVVRNSSRLYVLYAKCTHLGCTPDWRESDQKFKCPCHASDFCEGSNFDGNGINCQGPAPRPLDRAQVELNSEGQIVVNTDKLYQWPKDGRSEFDDPRSFIPLA
jgi:cytochrome b6-f complex iron-sulfur subunit